MKIIAALRDLVGMGLLVVAWRLMTDEGGAAATNAIVDAVRGAEPTEQPAQAPRPRGVW